MAIGIMKRLFGAGSPWSGLPKPGPIEGIDGPPKKKRPMPGQPTWPPDAPPKTQPAKPFGSTLLTGGAAAPAVRNTLLGQ